MLEQRLQAVGTTGSTITMDAHYSYETELQLIKDHRAEYFEMKI